VASSTTSPTANGNAQSGRGGAPTSAIQPAKPTGGGGKHHHHIRHGHTTSRTKPFSLAPINLESGVRDPGSGIPLR
jgi:hypothetical protein